VGVGVDIDLHPQVDRSYQTAWAMLGRLRSVLVRPGRGRLSGTVKVDETYIGGDEPGPATRSNPWDDLFMQGRPAQWPGHVPNHHAVL
jgi:hypothetical protein